MHADRAELIVVEHQHDRRRPWWNAVASSWPVIMKPPSPTMLTTMRPGKAILAPIAAGTEYPIAPLVGPI